MYVLIKSLVGMVITDEISHEGLYIVTLYGEWYDAIVSRWYF